jgi:hypothetical protein
MVMCAFPRLSLSEFGLFMLSNQLESAWTGPMSQHWTNGIGPTFALPNLVVEYALSLR